MAQYRIKHVGDSIINVFLGHKRVGWAEVDHHGRIMLRGDIPNRCMGAIEKMILGSKHFKEGFMGGSKKKTCDDEITLNDHTYVRKDKVKKPAKDRKGLVPVVVGTRRYGVYFGWTAEPTAIPLKITDVRYRSRASDEEAAILAVKGRLDLNTRKPPLITTEIPGETIMHEPTNVFPCTEEAVDWWERSPLHTDEDDYHSKF